MWIVTNFGFFSVVRKPGDTDLTVRARAKADLEALGNKYLPDLQVIKGGGTDYEFRAKVSRQHFADVVKQIALDIDYSNFKNSVAKEQGYDRSDLYHKVWSALQGVARLDVSDDNESEVARRDWSYGGVIFDDQGRVLLRKPLNEYDNYVWTFPKGRGEPGEPVEDVARREVLEESGVEAEIMCLIPGSFRGGMGMNRYFLMKPVSQGAFSKKETEEVIWVTPEEARERIKETRNSIGRKRDLAVLESAVGVWAKLEREDHT